MQVCCHTPHGAIAVALRGGASLCGIVSCASAGFSPCLLFPLLSPSLCVSFVSAPLHHWGPSAYRPVLQAPVAAWHMSGTKAKQQGFHCFLAGGAGIPFRGGAPERIGSANLTAASRGRGWIQMNLHRCRETAKMQHLSGSGSPKSRSSACPGFTDIPPHLDPVLHASCLFVSMPPAGTNPRIPQPIVS